VRPNIQSDIYRIARESLGNTFRHAQAQHIETEITYRKFLRLRFCDDGKGIDPGIVEHGGRPGHWGLPGIRERAKQIGAQLEIWSELGAGTEIELCIPGSIAYEVFATKGHSGFSLSESNKIMNTGPSLIETCAERIQAITTLQYRGITPNGMLVSGWKD
jgi:histidine kinase/DNA gyrase B/HSP90-like ATPase